MSAISETPDITVSESSATQFGGWSKRLFDILVASCLIIALAPLFAVVAFLIRLSDGHASLIRHQRIGQSGRPFPCLKFRTMVPDAERLLQAHLASNPDARAEWERDRKLRNDPRVTPLGRVFRKLSIDELPQLFNVIRGEMSLVGPRPMVRDEIVRCGAAAAEVLTAPPGLTGLWQIKGRNDLPFDARISLNCQYIRNHSFALDMQILLMTIPVVVSRRGSC